MTRIQLFGRLSAVAMLTLAACTSAPRHPDSIARNGYTAIKPYVAELIRHEMKQNEIAGISIALVDDQRVIWADGFGHADMQRELPATAETLYRVGSVSKLLTATAAMQLAETGKLDIDKPLAEVLSGFSIRSRFPDANPITPRNLMTHHSGLPRDVNKGFFTRHPEPFTELVKKMPATDAAFPPDYLFSYSNIGITLLGHAIQNVSGEPFADHMQRAVLDPLGMKTARFATGLTDTPLMAQPYRKGERVEEVAIRDVPAGGLNASVLDLSRFLSMVFAEGRSGERQVLTPASVHEMLRPQNADVALDVGFLNGLGWMLSTLGTSTIRDAGPVAHHSGATVHYRAQLYALPRYKLGVVVLANSGSAGRSVDRIASEALSLALEAKTGIRQTPIAPVPPAAAPWPVERLRSYVGDYTTLAGLIHVALDGERLQVEAFGKQFDLIPRSDGRLGLRYRLLGFLPLSLGNLDAIGLSLRQLDGRDVLIANIGDQDMLLGERIHASPALGPWRKRIGRYEIANAGEDHTFVDRIALREDHGFLVVEIVFTDNMGAVQHLVVQPLSEHAAILLGPLADGGGVLRCATADGEERCAYGGYALKRIGP